MSDTTPDVEFDGDIFDAWLESGTTRRVTVTLYNDPTLEQDITDLENRRAEIEDRGNERMLDEKSPLAELERAEEALLARLEASKSTFTVKALLDTDFDAAAEAFPEPEAPQMLPKAAPAKAKEKWARDRDIYVRAAAEAERERRLMLIAKAVERVETTRGAAPGVTAEQLRRMLTGGKDQAEWAAYGTYRLGVLWKAVQEARRGDVKVPAPK